MKKSKKMHFYLFSCVFDGGSSHGTLGFKRKRIVTSDLIAAEDYFFKGIKKENPSCRATSVSVSGFSYLGHMTKEEWEG